MRSRWRRAAFQSLRAIVSLAVFLPTASAASSFGIAGAGATGCTCHIPTVASPTTRVCIVGLPSDGTYAPGTTYPLRIFVDGLGAPPLGVLTGGRIAGFSLTAIGGTLAPLPGDGSVQKLGGDLTHAGDAGNDRNHWDVTWTAPASGDVVMYAGGNAVNSDGASTGDLWNRMELTLTAGAGSGAGEGIHCSIDLPLPQLLPLPAATAAVPAH